MDYLKLRALCGGGRSYSSCSSGACTSTASYPESITDSTVNYNGVNDYGANMAAPLPSNHRRGVAPYLKQASVNSTYDNDCYSDDNDVSHDVNGSTYDERRPFVKEPDEIDVEDVGDYVDNLDDTADDDQNIKNGDGDDVRLIENSLRSCAFDDGDDERDDADADSMATCNFTMPLRCCDDKDVDKTVVSKFSAKSLNGVKTRSNFELNSLDCSLEKDQKNIGRHQQFSVTDTSQDFDTDFEVTLPEKLKESRLRRGDTPPQLTKLVLKRKPERDVSRYYKICTLGVGTFGRVSLARLKSTRQYYALKTMSIKSVVQFSQVDHVHSERRILESLDHPFIAKLYWAYKDDRFLYMLFDYMPGGELFSYIRVKKRFKDDTARFYASEILLALEYLHSKRIVYRDLKPENLLLDCRGHVILIDFGFSKVLTDRTWTMCGTAEYLAPEIILGTGHNRAVDFWAFGVLIYEMLVGKPPFRGDTTYQTYQKILSGKLKFPQRFCPLAKKLIRHLLVVDRTKRLGSSRAHSQDIRNQAWFANIDWVGLYNRSMQPPIIPRIHCEGDSGNFDEYDETNDIFQNTEPAEQWESDLFEDW